MHSQQPWKLIHLSKVGHAYLNASVSNSFHTFLRLCEWSVKKYRRSALFHTTLNNIKGCEYLICFSSVSLFCLSPFNGRCLCFVFTSFLLFFVFSVFCSCNLACSAFLFLFDDYRSLYLSGIGTQDGSAKKDEDFKGKSQRQVQFNPGQTTATWRVRILTDGKYEQAETFQILLSEPVMGVMEFPDTAIVEILDPSDGQSCIYIMHTWRPLNIVLLWT